MTRPSDAPDERRQAQLVQDLARGVQRAVLDAVLQVGAGLEADRVAMTVPRARVPTAPAWLARHHPGGAQARAQAQALYERCLTHYREIVCADTPAAGYDDVGALLARFVAANVAAFRDLDVTPAMLGRMEQQLAGVLQLSPGWLRADLRERQCYVEQLAIIGVLVRETSVQAVLEGPAAVANVQRAAHRYLMQLLGVDAERLTITDQGLVFAEAGATA
jgi:hypothetical protein